jgi:hypothetical protein
MKDISNLKNIAQAFKDIESLCNTKEEIDLTKQEDYVKDEFLHQDRKTSDGQIITEEESAKFEIEQPEIFNFIRNFQEKIREIIKRSI